VVNQARGGLEKMEETSSTNPLIVSLFFILRCVIPLIIMLGISYLLQRLGVIAKPTEPPADRDNGDDSHAANGGDLAHAKH
jgi:hypothetical protein